MMNRETSIRASIILLVAFFVTVDVSAQVYFVADEKRISVNGRIIESSNLPKNLPDLVPRGFSLYSVGSFPMRVKINDLTYEIWRDRIVESCGTGNLSFKLQIGPDPDFIEIATMGSGSKEPRHQIETPFLVNSFKGDGQETDLFINYGIPPESIPDLPKTTIASADFHTYAALDSIIDYPNGTIEVNANVTSYLSDDQGETHAERTKNIDGFSTNQIVAFPDQNLLVGTQQMQLQPGTYELFVVLEMASKETHGVWTREISVPDYDQIGVTLSDIMLAYSVEQAENGVPPSTNEIIRNDLSILPAPRSLYSTELPIYLYFEIYGLTLNAQGRTDYDVEITLEPKNTDRRIRRVIRSIFGKKRNREGVSVSYTENGSLREESLYQILDVSDQKTGPYTLTLVVRDNETGKESERTQSLFLERWGFPCSE
ncbi:MAG: hypothetical protein OXD43_06360 [Bacteroidetes bacterium]|nr:hypothetical protein [Bacteroidota bacterium]